MSTADALRALLEKALQDVRNSSTSELDSQYIIDIGSNFGQLIDAVHFLDNSSRKRIFLITLTVHRIIPIWERSRSNDTSPHRLLTIVNQLLDEKIEIVEVVKQEYEFLDWVDYQTEDCESNAAICVAYSLHALLETIKVISGIYSKNPPHTAENYANAAILFAADAYSYGFLREGRTVAMVRREFWEWWLTKVVPSAWMTPRG